MSNMEVKETSATKRYRSVEARMLVADGEFDLADIAESNHLIAHGRITSSTGKVSNVVDGARLDSVDSGIVKIRVDCIAIPEFWLEIELPVEQLLKFVKK